MFYEVRLAFNDRTQDVVITAEELPIALWGFAKNGKVILSSGAFRGQDIISILPDKITTMGWNKGHRPTPEDWNEIQMELGRKLEDYQEEVKQQVFQSNTMQELMARVKELPTAKLLN